MLAYGSFNRIRTKKIDTEYNELQATINRKVLASRRTSLRNHRAKNYLKSNNIRQSSPYRIISRRSIKPWRWRFNRTRRCRDYINRKNGYIKRLANTEFKAQPWGTWGFKDERSWWWLRGKHDSVQRIPPLLYEYRKVYQARVWNSWIWPYKGLPV